MRDYVAEAPDELYLDGGISSRPGEDSSGRMSVCWAGPLNQTDKWIEPIRKAGTPIFDGIGPVDYVALQRSSDVSDPRARSAYVKSGFTTGIDRALIDEIFAGFEEHPDRAMAVAFAHVGGAVNRVPVDATAFAHRYAKHDLLSILDWPVGMDATDHIAWLKQYWKTLEPYTHGFYVNDPSFDESRERVHANYQGNFPRLVELKDRYDPTNLFRLNANVQPTV